MTILSLKNISKEYKFGEEYIYALNDISLDIFPGELIVIMGASGSGKSTLLNILSGLDRPTKGIFKFQDTNMQNAGASLLAWYRQKIIGVIFQSFNLIPTMSVRDNIRISRLFSSESKKTIEQDIDKILAQVDIENREKLVPTRLSGGQQQRVAIARALINKPQIILADEPTGNLDSKNGENIISILKNLNKEEKKTVIIVTHNPDIAKIADRVVYMKDGTIEKIDTINNSNVSNNIDTPIYKFSKKDLGKLSLISGIKIAFGNIKRTKLRTFLTSFGVAIGIAALVLLVSFAAGLQKNTVDSITSVFSLKQITVTNKSSSTANFSFAPPTAQQASQDITDQTIATIKKLNHVSSVYFQNILLGTLTYNGKQTTLTDENSAPVQNIDSSLQPIKYGRDFNSDNENSIIVPDGIANAFGIKNPQDLVGQTVNVNLSVLDTTGTSSFSKPFKQDMQIIGISGNSGLASTALTPYNVFAPQGKNITYSRLVVNVDNINNVKSVKDVIDKMGYGTTSTQDIISQIQQVFLILQGVLGVIAGIALVIACLGIMNIMLISVFERFKEIGIMKAIGARARDIKILFVMEACIIGILGGLTGIILGIFSGLILNQGINAFIKSSSANKSNLFYVPPYLLALSIGIALFFSIIASLYPASRASKLNPIDALRRE